MTIAPGAPIVADDILAATNKVIKRARRTTTTGSTSAAVVLGVLRLDSVPVVSGRVYRIMASGIAVDGSDTTSVYIAMVRVNTSGTATISSPMVPAAWIRGTSQNATDGMIMPLNALYVPAGSGNHSFLLTLQRTQGAGAFTMQGDVGFPIDLWVEDAGADPGDTGTDI